MIRLQRGSVLVRFGEQIRQSDVSFWGVIALSLGAFAMLCANITTFLPDNMLIALHATRLEGGNINQLRTQIANLQTETARIRNENGKLVTMITLAEQGRGVANQRIGALESSMPALLEPEPAMSQIDSSLITAGIDDDTVIMEAEGGSVAISQSPIESAAQPMMDAPVSSQNAMPATPIKISDLPELEPALPAPDAYGIALGPQVTVQDAILAWRDITTKVGPLILGLGPLLSGNAGAEQQRLVAGPIAGYAEAEQLCVRMIRIGISCLPVPYAGRALPE